MQFGILESVYYWGHYRQNAVAAYANGSSVTYKELCWRIEVLAKRLVGLQGGRVGALCRNKLDYLVAVLAIQRSGKSVVLLNPGLSPEALKVNVTDTAINHVVTDRDSQDLAQRIGVEVVEIKPEPIDNAWAVHNVLSDLPLFGPTDEWAVFFSSGSTGVPKGIERNNESVVTEAIGWCLELSLNRRTRYYISRPVYYTGGMVLTTATLLVGGSVILNDLPNETSEELWRDVKLMSQTHTIDHAFFVPDQLRAFLKNKGAWSCPLPSTCILVMGALITGEEKAEVADALQCNLVESWGNSESLGTITDPEDLAKRPGSIGRPFLTDQMYVLDEAGKVLGPNQIGRIAGASEAGFTKYSNRPDETQRALTADMIVSEDLGYTDQDGYFFIVGRMQDAVIRKGKTIYLSNVDKQLRKLGLPEVAVCAIEVGDDDCDIVAVGIPHEAVRGMDPTKAARKLSSELPAEERLSLFVAVDALPRVPSGKIDRQALKDIARAALEADSK